MKTTLADRIHRLAHNEYWLALDRWTIWVDGPHGEQCWREVQIARDVLEMASEGL